MLKNYSTQKHNESSIIEYFYYEIINTEGVRHNFKPKWKGLHACKVTASADSSIFDSLIAENFTDRSDGMCHMETGDTK